MERDEKVESEKGCALISIIIPVYNVLPYLKKCIESVINQTYRNLEILLIDDGSDDGSEVVCDQYGKRDERIKVFHKSNGGLSSARNYGLQYVTGDYVGFVDSDDYIDIKMYEHLMAVLGNDVDLAACGVHDEYIKRYKRKYCASNFTYGYQSMNRCEAIKELLLLRIFSFSVCNKLFRRKLFDNVVFPEGKSYEDIPVVYNIFLDIKCAVSNSYADYHYVHHPESITIRDFSESRLDFCYFTKEILDDVSIRYPQYKMEAVTLYIRSVYSNMCQILNSSNREAHKETYKKLKLILMDYKNVVKESDYIDENTRRDMLSKLGTDLDEMLKESDGKLRKNSYKDQINKLSEFYNLLIQWVSLKERGITAGDFMRRNGYRTAAVYGMKELGELLYEELKNAGIRVEYVIDQVRESIFIDVPVLKPEEPLYPVDVIIVTAVHYFEEIRESLQNKVDCPILSLEDVLFFEYE